jgi:beta-N-acetylglucosaminidase
LIIDARNWQYKDAESNDSKSSFQFIPLQGGETYVIKNNPMTNDTTINFLSLHIDNGVLVKTYGSQGEGEFAYVRADKKKLPNLFGWSAYDDPSGVGKSVSITCCEATTAVTYALTAKDILMIGDTPVFQTSAK